jgi:hypothetical protein
MEDRIDCPLTAANYVLGKRKGKVVTLDCLRSNRTKETVKHNR